MKGFFAPIIMMLTVCLLVVGLAARAPSPAKDLGQIVFSALGAGNWDLWIMNGDGTGPRRLTQTPVDERTPCLSDDGRRLVYSTSEGRLMTMDLAEASATEIALPDGNYGVPVWLAGSKIAFVSFVFSVGKNKVNDDSSVLVYDLAQKSDRDNPRVLIDQTGLQNWLSAFSGRYLLYSSSVQGPNQKVTQDLWTYDLTAQDGNQVTMLNASSIQGEWSPDGKEIVFSSNKTGNYEIWKWAGKSGALTRLTHTGASNLEPCWSPDGRMIVFVSDRGGHRDLWIMSGDGSGPKAMSPFGQKVECAGPFWGKKAGPDAGLSKPSRAGMDQ